jgi:hypothetical protein
MILHDRLVNWGRGVRHIGVDRLRILSAEGAYRSPQRNHWEEPVHGIRQPIDVPDAWEIERAVVLIPLHQHVCLRASYVDRLGNEACRRLVAKALQERWQRVDLQAVIGAAHASLEDELGRPAATRADRMREYVSRVFGLTSRIPSCISM